MNKVSIWLSTMRLRTLPLSISGIILGSCLAYDKGFFQWGIFALAILTTLSFQILSNFANDYGDGIKGTDNNERIGPERAIQSGKITPKQLLNAIKLNIVISIILAVLLIYYAFGTENLILIIIFLLLGISSIIAAMRYTMGNNAYGYKGLGDVFVFLFFGLVSVIGCYVLFAKQMDTITLLPACTIGLLSAAVLNLNNMRDIASDLKSNKVTLAVKLGKVWALRYHNILIISAFITSALFGFLHYVSPYNLIYFVAYIPLAIHLKKANTVIDAKLFDPELKKLALTTVLLAVLMGIGQLL
ncbi:1,4-dihydroxy-2-naphthoate octaprenyltransferase [uncultured Algibacter sp.]|uniref:1,4-dihydroxy-2-naphthoate octaprenyltransferase n=1 Tax=uncultured Algibacter sp. TaxID=298659 RepID=UPI00321719D1